MSPYIVTTKRPNAEGIAAHDRTGDPYTGDGAHWLCTLPESQQWVVSRVAVGTLEEARKATRRKLEPFLPGGVLKGDPAKWLSAAWSVPESGGSVGPLPDGSLVEVSQLPWFKLAIEAHMLPQWQQGADTPWVEKTKRDILAAYNAREAS